jgi:hypothetical protein
MQKVQYAVESSQLNFFPCVILEVHQLHVIAFDGYVVYFVLWVISIPSQTRESY